MPVILINKTAFETYFNECKTLALEIAQTNSQVLLVESQLLSEGVVRPNVKKLIADAKKLNKPLNRVNFKKVSNVLSVSPTEVDPALDSNIRTKLSDLFAKDISATVVEPIKRKQLADKIKLSKNYGIPSAVFQKTVNLIFNQTDYILESEIVGNLQNGCMISITDANVQIGDNVPTNEETDSIVNGAATGII